MIHPLACVGKNLVLGDQSKVWAFANIEDGVTIGSGCAIGSHTYVGSGARLGDGVRVQSFVSICRGAILEDGVFVSPHVCITDDKHPRAGNPGYDAQPPILRKGCSIGASALIMPGIEIGEGAMVGAGAVVTHNVPAGAVVMGVPAKPRLQVVDTSFDPDFKGAFG